jgi:acyl carrier protein
MNARATFINSTLEWINTRLAPPGVVVTAETALFAEGIISSIKVLDLIAWTERAIGREIADIDIKLDNFRTVARIAEVFVKEERHAAA